MNEESSGVATGWTGVDMSTPLLLEVAPEIDTNPTSFYRGTGVGGESLRLQTPVIGSRSALAMSVQCPLEESDSSGDRRAVGSRFQVLGPYAAKLH